MYNVNFLMRLLRIAKIIKSLHHIMTFHCLLNCHLLTLYGRRNQVYPLYFLRGVLLLWCLLILVDFTFFLSLSNLYWWLLRLDFQLDDIKKVSLNVTDIPVEILAAPSLIGFHQHSHKTVTGRLHLSRCNIALYPFRVL